ncbi:MAG: ABC-2 family transporter protein [Eubacteriales bacterium]
MGRIKCYFRVGALYFKQSLQTALEYPTSLAGWFISNLMQFGIGFAIIKFVVDQFGTLQGWGLGELAFLYGLSVLSHGVSVVLFVPTWYMGSRIVDGELDLYLLRPLGVMFQFLFSYFNLIGLTDLISGIIIFAYGCIRVGFVWSGANVLFVFLVIIGGALIRGAIWLILGSISFWVKNRASFTVLTMQLYDKTTMYPLSIYPQFLQMFFTVVIPLGWITFYPASYLLGKELPVYMPVSMPLVTMIIGVLWFVLGCLMFQRGLKRYESAGT